MVSNYVAQFLKDNTLEVGDEFRVYGNDDDGYSYLLGRLYRIDDENGGTLKYFGEDGMLHEDQNTLIKLLTGQIQVYTPYLPKLGDVYFYNEPYGITCSNEFKNKAIDFMLRKAHKCHRTIKEAQFFFRADIADWNNYKILKD